MVRKSENMMKSHTHLFIYVTVSLQFRACFSRKISKYQQWRDIFVPCIDRLFLNNRSIIIHSFYSNTFFKDLKISVLCDLPVKLLSDKLYFIRSMYFTCILTEIVSGMTA